MVQTMFPPEEDADHETLVCINVMAVHIVYSRYKNCTLD